MLKIDEIDSLNIRVYKFEEDVGRMKVFLTKMNFIVEVIGINIEVFLKFF